MRARQTPHTPTEYSSEYRLTPKLSVRLLPGNASAYQQMLGELTATLQADGLKPKAAENEAGLRLLSIWTYALWDDPRIEWAATDDPDEVLLSSGSSLANYGRRLSQELTGPGALRCGLGPDAIDVLARRALPRAMFGLASDDMLPGEAPPPPSES